MSQIAQKLLENLGRVIVGKEDVLHNIVSALLAGGHVLLQDVPGTGKTMMARTLAKSLDVSFSRIQFTPDLLPTDISGVSVYNQKTQEFEFREGPVFNGVILADELNRATPRTQSALLEVMEEKTVSIDGITHPMPPPFFVIATQNPIEQQGVYDLPEAQLDRFLVQLEIGYPSLGEERRIVEEQRQKHPIEDIEPVISADEVVQEQKQIRDKVQVEPNVLDYIVRLVQETRNHKDLSLGCSPRASLSLYRTAQASTWIKGQDFVSPDTVKKLARAVLSHRMVIKPQSRIAGVQPEDVVTEILSQVDVPLIRMK